MFAKINITKIIVDHLHTLNGSSFEQGKPQISCRDISLFYGFPFVAAIIATILNFVPSETLLNSGLVSLAIFVPLLTNVVFLIHSIMEQNQKYNKVSKLSVLLREIYCNISYTILVAFISLTLVIIALVGGNTCYLINGTIIFCATHLCLTGVMILKRLHVLMLSSFEQ